MPGSVFKVETALKNLTGRPGRLVGIEASCGCIKPLIKLPSSLPAGGETVLPFEITAPEAYGERSLNVLLKIETASPNLVNLTISYVVTEDILVEPKRVLLTGDSPVRELRFKLDKEGLQLKKVYFKSPVDFISMTQRNLDPRQAAFDVQFKNPENIAGEVLIDIPFVAETSSENLPGMVSVSAWLNRASPLAFQPRFMLFKSGSSNQQSCVAKGFSFSEGAISADHNSQAFRSTFEWSVSADKTQLNIKTAATPAFSTRGTLLFRHKGGQIVSLPLYYTP